MIPIIYKILSFAESPNPKLQYAMLHTIGQIAEDMAPKFEEHFGELLIPTMIKLAGSPVPRVRAHSANAMTNFLENMTTAQIRPYLNDLVKVNMLVLSNGVSIEKESAVSSIASIAKAALSEFEPFFESVFEYIFNLFNSCKAKEYILLKGRCL